MKKSLYALAAFGALAGVAQAQSSVTIYGIIDEGVQGGNTRQSLGGAANGTTGVIKNTWTTVAGSAESTNRIGIKGVEDLGGGVSVFFTAENKLDPMGGQFIATNGNRQTFVGLKKNGLGSIAAGTQYTPIHEAVSDTDPGNTNNLPGNLVYLNTPADTNSNTAYKTVTNSGVFNNGAYAVRLPNSLTLKSETYAGFKVRGYVVAANQNSTETTTGTTSTAGVGGNSNVSGFGIGGDYDWHQLHLTANYQSFKATANTNTVATAPVLFSAAGTNVVGTNVQDAGQYYAGTYDFGILKAYVQYINRKAADDQNTSYFQKYTAQQIGVRSFVTPVIEVWASGAVGKFANMPALGGTYTISTANVTGMQLGSNYWLSKRTNLYAIYGQTSTSNVAQTLGANTQAYNQNGYAVGMRHTF